MVQSEIICRTFRIAVGDKCGTAFTLESGNKQYIITAKHLFEHVGYPSEYDIEILKGGAYNILHSEIYYHQKTDVDVAVILTNPYIEISPRYDNENTTDGMIWGQDVYFLGFPYNYDALMVNLPNESTPAPFIKKACLSGFNKDGDLFLDGINNSGFSGGPVCYRELGQGKYKIAGIINSYTIDEAHVYNSNNMETDFYMQENTGIINACNIKRVYEILEMNNL